MRPTNPIDVLPFKSTVPGLQFPAMCDQRALPILGLLYQFERNQWIAPARHREFIFGQLSLLLQIAAKDVAYYHYALGDAGYDPNAPLTEEMWSKVPFLNRRIIQDEGKRLLSTSIPDIFQPFKHTKSSGSIGTPVEVYQPATKNVVMSATSLLEYVSHGVDFSKKAASIRLFKNNPPPPEGRSVPDWGTPTSLLLRTGPASFLSSGEDPERQADWVIREDPAYLQMFPSNLEALLPILKERGADLPGLRYFRTLGEQLPERLRADVRDQFGCKIVDVYSAQEVGCIAIQCPDHDHYHLVQDVCFTEILRDDGTPCAPGEIGRIVVTDLFNPAFPLIRYEIGDYAEMGAPCDCGRGWPVINRIMGRVRNLVTFPDGRREWPKTPNRLYSETVPMRQYQMIQTSLNDLHINMVATRMLTDDEKAKIVEITQDRFGHNFNVTIDQVDAITRGANGKYEEFRSEITPEMVAEARGRK